MLRDKALPNSSGYCHRVSVGSDWTCGCLPQSELLLRILLILLVFLKISLLFGKSWFPAYARLVRAKAVPADQIRQKNKNPRVGTSSIHTDAKASHPSLPQLFAHTEYMGTLLQHGCGWEAIGTWEWCRGKRNHHIRSNCVCMQITLYILQCCINLAL